MIHYDENENNTSSSSDYDEIDNFLDKYSDSIYLLYEELKSNFQSHSPFFLCKMRFYHLTTFLIDILFKSESESTLNDKNPFSLINDFNNFYKNEISYSFNMLSAYIKKHFKYTIHIEHWVFFCYNLSDIGEIQKVR